jgi:transposase-like protein
MEGDYFRLRRTRQDSHRRGIPFYSEAVKQQAVALYTEGNGISALSRLLNVEIGTVFSKPVGR